MTINPHRGQVWCPRCAAWVEPGHDMTAAAHERDEQSPR